MEFRDLLEPKYKEIISGYLKNQNEQNLYQGQKLSRKLIEHNISPEEIISLHKSIMVDSEATQEKLIDSFDVLLEVMMGYGLAYREHQSLRTEQMAIKNEIELAATMQQTLLKTSVPQMADIDIGALSVPARQMNGDYHHFVKDERDRIGIAIADVIGKGIPAALSMSMIKYAMDSMPDNRHNPSEILESLNRVVEQNVDPSMFITMFYGVYDPAKHTFCYATAGHEPGFFYDSATQQFQDLNGKGLLLGINKKTTYNEYEKEVDPGDMVILFSDGVSECRTEDGFIEREDIIGFIDKYIHLPVQEIVTNIYKDLERIQDFELRDDFTLIILKRTR
ncbi:PP2C family protein-serine/threonine phosphatase [Lederbergia lenta]|uniref:Protein serine/threonine phosphatase n=1 Tax=Lederbergia lenta TaxID=1467 RepID=A0A2X4VM71_LEDLE|nr:PP2C family protein-serine/threonine phosphatase [Lederbergia lenta]MCM3112279.1 PP2C family protein-serine/threonine phosphatase [Lederbergia lenta]MEC2326499.1 PP2C family protein-serine/threonine phosphatase [Lederbergia lenta]SQI53256.1 protein serine/threonine phosphatase [Lederbergia lenta]